MSNSSAVLLFVSDVHCQFHLINQRIEEAETRFGKPVAAVVVLGDFGFFAHTLKEFFVTRGARFLRSVYCIEGNHEEFDLLPQLVEEYREHVTFWPRGTVQSVAGVRFLCLGGAAYMDAMTTPMGAEIRDADIDRCLEFSADAVDIIVSHDCPKGVGVPNSPGFEHYGPPGFARGDELARRFRPRFWVFGHHHKCQNDYS